jgi:hypothetical protein
MGKNKKGTIKQITLLSIALTGAISVAMGSGKFTVWSTIVGLMLLFILLAYYFKLKTKFFKYLAFSSVFSFCLLIVFGLLLNYLCNQYLVFLIWLIITSIACLIMYIYKR